MRLDLRESGLTEIESKAYLSRKDVEELILPNETEKIGNWAFAHMKNLRKIVFPKKEILLGKEVFKGCDSLTEVVIGYEEKCDASYLLAAAMTCMEAQQLLKPEQVGSICWMAEFDRLLSEYIGRQDEIGFHPMWFGGEEDYDDNDTNVELYRKDRQKEKIRLLILRLRYDKHLPEERREEYRSMLCSLLNNDTEPFAYELWEMVEDCYGQESDVIEILLRSGCVTKQNFANVMEALSSAGPESKAVLLRWHAAQQKTKDFFERMKI